MKPCSRCGDPKPLTEFWVITKNRDGRDGICKECRSSTRVRTCKQKVPTAERTLRDTIIHDSWAAKIKDKDIAMILAAKGINMSPTTIKTYRASRGWVKSWIVQPKCEGMTYVYYDYKGDVDRMMDGIFSELKRSPIGRDWQDEGDFRGWIKTGVGQQYLEHLNKMVSA